MGEYADMLKIDNELLLKHITLDIMENKAERIKLKLKDKYGALSFEFPIVAYQPCGNYAMLSRATKGDELVLKIMDLINLPQFTNIISESANISAISNNMFDIIFRIKGDPRKHIRGIQVKTLISDNDADDAYYTGHIHDNYPDNTLMIFCNYQMTRFAVGYYKNFKIMSERLYFNFNKSNDNHLKFTDIALFENKLLELSINATIINNVEDGILVDGPYKEYKSLRMIKYHCEKRGIRFEYHYKSDTPIDIFLNGHPCQCKFTSDLNSFLYEVDLSKTQKKEMIPYTDKDGIQYFIVQVNHPENTYDYSHDICIIPIKVLIDQKRIKTDCQPGFKQCGIAPPNHADYHWCESMWNNYDLLKNSIDEIDDPVYNLLTRYKFTIKNTSTKQGHKYKVQVSAVNMNDRTVDYFAIFINDKTERLYRDYVCIISKSDIIKENKAPEKSVLKRVITVCPPNYNLISTKPDWSLKYWKKITDL
jgi:hypothetical protein